MRSCLSDKDKKHEVKQNMRYKLPTNPSGRRGGQCGFKAGWHRKKVKHKSTGAYMHSFLYVLASSVASCQEPELPLRDS